MKHTENFLDTYKSRMEHEDPVALGFELLFMALADLLLKDDRSKVEVA